MVIGVTGGSGSGKSYIAKKFIPYGFEIIDADRIAKEIMMTDNELKSKIIKIFGISLLVDGQIDRKALGKIVFADSKKLERLNSLTHPAIISKIKKEVKLYDKCVIDAPLLFEAGLHRICDYTVAVFADDEVRIKRIIDRDNIDAETAINRIASQMSNMEYIDKTDYCVKNNGNENVDILIYSILEDIAGR